MIAQKRQKILLYNPRSVFYDMPLALLAIGSVLDPQKYEVIIVDGRLEDDPLPRMLKEAEGALCLGVTALTGSPLRDAVRVTRAIKLQYPDLPVVWGGWHPSLFPKETLRDEPAIDVTVQGQGEDTFAELVECFAERASIQMVKGIAYRSQEGEIQQNPARSMVDVNSFPRLNYDLVNVEDYFRFKGRRQLDYISSAGCRFRCTFCADPFVYQRAWSGLEPERMGEELAFWQKKYSFSDVNFQDETFFTKRDRVSKIAEELIRREVKTTWAGTLRADQGSRMTEEDFDLVRASGLRRVLVGVESGSQEMMDWLKKDIKMEQVYETARRCRDRDIAVIFPFIVGFPNESEASLKASLTVAAELNAMHPEFTTPIFYFKPYPGSQITQEVVANGYALPQTLDEWADFDYIGSSGPWVSKEKYQMVERFKFYSKLAWRKNPWYLQPLQALARQRCQRNWFDMPVEKMIFDTIYPTLQLS